MSVAVCVLGESLPVAELRGKTSIKARNSSTEIFLPFSDTDFASGYWLRCCKGVMSSLKLRLLSGLPAFNGTHPQIILLP